MNLVCWFFPLGGYGRLLAALLRKGKKTTKQTKWNSMKEEGNHKEWTNQLFLELIVKWMNLFNSWMKQSMEKSCVCEWSTKRFRRAASQQLNQTNAGLSAWAAFDGCVGGVGWFLFLFLYLFFSSFSLINKQINHQFFISLNNQRKKWRVGLIVLWMSLVAFLWAGRKKRIEESYELRRLQPPSAAQRGKATLYYWMEKE